MAVMSIEIELEIIINESSCASFLADYDEGIKRQRTSEAQAAVQTTTMDSASAVVEFKLPFVKIKNVSAGEAVYSDPISAGVHMRRINCFPRGTGPRRTAISQFFWSSSANPRVSRPYLRPF